MHPRAFRLKLDWRAALLAALLAATWNTSRAQVSANDELDACMREAAVSGAVTGGSIGGTIGALFGDRARDRLNKALGGAAVGAAVGAIASWQLAYKSCAARFATASSLITDEYAACAQRFGYARVGLVVAIDGTTLPALARGGERLATDVAYHVLTPDPKDVPLQLTRRFLCKDEDGRFNELASPTERMTVSSGCHRSAASLLLPTRIPAEQTCRMEITLEAEGQTRSHSGDFRILP